MRNKLRIFAIWIGPALLICSMIALMWRDLHHSAFERTVALRAIEASVRDLNAFWEDLVAEQRAINARRDSIRRDSAS